VFAFQQSDGATGKLGLRRRDHPGGDLFKADFKQEL
jgi:hypothetical protein